MTRFWLKAAGFLPALILFPQPALAVSSAELYTAASYPYGRFEARARFAAGDGVVSSFFLWKDGSEQTGVFWNELDFEKVAAECRLETNPIYGKPAANHTQRHALALDLCGSFHTYAYEWTPEAAVWLVDGMEIRRDTGATAQAFAENAQQGMQIHLNLWPGDASFGGNFSPSILPVHQYVDWVQYSAYENGAFTLAWREDFNGSAVPDGWLTGSWASPKNRSTHSVQNVNFLDGYAVLSLTADDALGPAGAMPGDTAQASGGTGASAEAGSGTTTAGSAAAGSPGGASSGGAAGSSQTSATSADDSGGCNFGHGSPSRGLAMMALGVAAIAWLRRRLDPSRIDLDS